MENSHLFLRKIFTDKNLADEIFERSQYLEIQKRQSIINQGDYIKVIPFVITGKIKVSRQDESGKEVMLYSILPGETCAMTLASGLRHQESAVYAETEVDTQLFAIPLTDFEELLVSYPKLNDFIVKTFHIRFEELIKVVDSVTFKTIEFRLINLLKKLQTRNYVVKATHQELADQLATAREVVSRLLKQLEKDKKIINHRGYIEIIDLM
ncbi:MAG: Crp/Fnr family transcriptional regulator [Bacteroidales bacterium]|nr:Crp/Fnr family transcriptional regulator [Bacteroidales bacterium]